MCDCSSIPEQFECLEMESSGNESEYNELESIANAGWADVMQKILRTRKPKRKKTVVFAKAKKLCDVKVTKEKEEEISFKIDGMKEEKAELHKANIKTVSIAYSVPKKKDKSLGIRIKPSITDRERERMLQKVATKGVVQLFNAVRQQQTDISKKLSEAGPLERKREQVLKHIDKNSFLDILMGGAKSIQVDNSVKSEETVESTENNKKDNMWSVLRDNFVMGANLKDWDKEKNIGGEDSSAPEDMDSDD